jgi:DNA repair photolyase
MKIKEVKCKTLLCKTGLPADWCANPYTGCQHGCKYCYARFMKKYTHHPEPWGEFVDVKINAPEVLEKEVKTKPKGRVYLSSVTDPYQPLERKYQLTRRILEILRDNGFTATIQTKSDLILRDLDILKEIKDLQVGFTITTTDDKIRRIFEPFASPVENRFRALKTLKKQGLTTFCMIAPILPGLTDVKALKKRLEGLVDFVWEDNLNIRYGNWPDIEKTVRKFYPQLLPEFQKRIGAGGNPSSTP